MRTPETMRFEAAMTTDEAFRKQFNQTVQVIADSGEYEDNFMIMAKACQKLGYKISRDDVYECAIEDGII